MRIIKVVGPEGVKKGMEAGVNPDLGGEIGSSSDARNCHRDHTHIKATRKIYF
jgi:hypothetical protein